jgi:hypothetical protein
MSASAFEVLLPVGTLIAGSLLTMFNQGLVDQRTYRRERAARLDEFRIKRYEIDRDTLLQLQDLLITYEMLPEAVDVDEGKYNEAAERARMLAERCLDKPVRDYVQDYVYQRGELYFHTDWPAPELADGCMDLYISAQLAIGKAFRSDPLAAPDGDKQGASRWRARPKATEQPLD